MASYMMAMTINPHAKKEYPDLTHHVDESLEAFSRNKVKGVRVFATLGRYDYLAIFEAEDQTLPYRVASEISNQGVLQTETWPLIPYEDFSKLIR
jgi:uncharacterized protein with GYD domain